MKCKPPTPTRQSGAWLELRINPVVSHCAKNARGNDFFITISLHNLTKYESSAITETLAANGGLAEKKGAALNLSGDRHAFACLAEGLKKKHLRMHDAAELVSDTITGFFNPVSSVKTKQGVIDFKNRTVIMGIVNVTPDSFSDGGKFFSTETAVKHALDMVRNGAEIIDIGGESSRPGAEPVSVEEELKRTIPVISAIAGKTTISIDTVKAEVAGEALRAGAGIVNDISALNYDPDMARVCAEHNVPVILMHMLGTPQTMQANPAYKDLYGEIILYLRQAIHKAVNAGVPRRKIIVDPGIGFGKTVEHNLRLIAELHKLKSLGLPILSGPSRKSFIGKILDLPSDQRMEGTAAAVSCSIMNGANIIRVHDVKEMTRVARITDAVQKMRKQRN